MIYSDEKDYVMRMIKEMARVIFSLAFDKTYVSVEMEKANKYRVSGKALNDLWEMIDAGQINEAENLMVDGMKANSRRDFLCALLFYDYLNKKEEAFLKAHQYTRQEIREGLSYAIGFFGYESMAEAFLEELDDGE